MTTWLHVTVGDRDICLLQVTAVIMLRLGVDHNQLELFTLPWFDWTFALLPEPVMIRSHRAWNSMRTPLIDAWTTQLWTTSLANLWPRSVSCHASGICGIVTSRKHFIQHVWLWLITPVRNFQLCIPGTTPYYWMFKINTCELEMHCYIQTSLQKCLVVVLRLQLPLLNRLRRPWSHGYCDAWFFMHLLTHRYFRFKSPVSINSQGRWFSFGRLVKWRNVFPSPVAHKLK